MSANSKRTIGGILLLMSIGVMIWFMIGIVTPSLVVRSGDMIKMLLLIALLFVVSVYIIITTIKDDNIKNLIMRFIVIVIFGVYIIALLYVMILSRVSDGAYGRSFSSEYGYDYNLIPFKSITNMISMVVNNDLNIGIMIDNFTGNIIMFMPMVIFIKVIFNNLKKDYMCVVISALISVGLEIIQCLTYVGSFDIDDMILNITGMVIAYFMTKMVLFDKILNKLYLKDNKCN